LLVSNTLGSKSRASKPICATNKDVDRRKRAGTFAENVDDLQKRFFSLFTTSCRDHGTVNFLTD